MATETHTNALIHETSPYLLQHAHNPVDWHAWGDEAFAKARREQRPIFLSVGYSTCYWCHVMERQCFEVEAIAAIQNAHFVNIKVDREERPDVDDVYMTATQLMTRQGGWPMSVFLTPPGAKGEDDPGLRPFYCGTYFPPEPMHGRASFPQVLEGVAGAWRDRREEVLQQADRLAEAVQQSLDQQAPAGPVDAEVVQAAANRLLRMYDPDHGGFGRAPKFPQPANLALLLEVVEHHPNAELAGAIAQTLDRMARGGMYDQIGGGFHRYSVDEKWLVPHFEKMLYDNGQLLSLYADAARWTEDPAQRDQWRRVLRETGDYLLREMTDATGAFWSAQDAEVDAKEGGNYVWTAEEVRAAIDDADLQSFAMQLYGLDEGPNFQDPHHPEASPVNVLYLPRPLHELGADAAAKREQVNAMLLAVRDQRKQPGTDDKVLAGWNGMAIAGLARAGQVLDEPRFIEAAAAAADAVMEHMTRDDGGLLRSMRSGEAKIPAFLEDYAFFIDGLLALHEAGAGNGAFLAAAKRLADVAIERFGMPGGGYYDTLADQADLLVRKRSLYDGAIPSGNSQMVHVLIDLHAATGEARYVDRAVADLRRASEELSTQAAGLPHMARALLRLLMAGGETVRQWLAASAEPATASDVAAPVSARVDPQQVRLADGQARFHVVFDIAAGFHVAAHDPGGGLVGTTLLMEGADGVSLDVSYPEPESATFAFADEPLKVYTGQVTLEATLLAAGAFDVRQANLILQVQACDDRACQAPQRIELPLVIQ